MKRVPYLLAGAAVLALVAVAVAAYFHDQSQSGRIAHGIKIGGVDVGGLNRGQAEAKLQRALVEPLQDPVVVSAPGGTQVRLSPARARLRLNIDASIASALRTSREGSIITRTWRDVIGQKVERSLQPELTFSRRAVRATVRTVADRVNRAPADATVKPSGRSLRKLPGRYGLAVRRAALQRGIIRRLVAREGPNHLRVPTRRVKPKVTSAELPSHYPAYIIVDRKHFQLRLFQRLHLARTYRIAVGRQGLETPAGLYGIQSKQVNPSWHVPKSSWAGDLAGKVIPPGPRDPIKARWMGFNGGAGIHGTDEVSSLGSAASHGCIRMAIPDVVRLYRKVDVGTPVYVE
jgi:predicted ribosomally synthesized peptide with SipW-like signal peptide